MSTTIQQRVIPDSMVNLDCCPLLQRIYHSRGIQSSIELELSLKHLHHVNLLKGVDAAASRIADAICKQSQIMIIGDFDADGATSTALCMLALRDLGAKHIRYLVPNRFDFGYGLSPEIVDVAAEQHAELIITVDNGIACVDGVERARQHGIDVVITDHHLAGEALPNATAIVNPNQPECQFPSKHLAGVGVAFYVMLAVRQQLVSVNWFRSQSIPEPNLANYLDIVALGTVADVVKLDHNNRILVHQGLQRIRSGQCRAGITAILSVAKRKPQALVASDLGFAVGPRLNAAGRLDDMSLGIECLMTEDDEHAASIAESLNQLNVQRREIETEMQQEAELAIASVRLDGEIPRGLALYEPQWHQGVIGIVAGRIKERFYRPTIAFAHQDEHVVKGSARSIPGVHIRDVLDQVNTENPQLIEKFGGHAMAAGLSLKKENLSAFEAAFQSVLNKTVAADVFSPVIESDGQLLAEEYDLSVAELLKQAGPWGQGFPEPVFDAEMILVSQRVVGEKHLKVRLVGPCGLSLDGIHFNMDQDSWPMSGQPSVRVVFTLDVNEFRQQRSLQLLIKHIELQTNGKDLNG